MFSTSAKPKYPRLTLADLAGFEEDRATAKAFERRFMKPLLSGLAVAFIGVPGFWALGYFLGQSLGGEIIKALLMIGMWLSLLVGMAILYTNWRRMQKAVPVSLRSGQPMAVYEFDHHNQPDDYELVYVCRASRTYFRRMYQEPGGAW